MDESFIMDYRLFSTIGELGGGSSGTVFHMRDHKGQDFAVKLFPHYMNDTTRRQFASEADIVRRFLHPCVVQVIGYFLPSKSERIDGAIIMEFVPGSNLASTIDTLTFDQKLLVTAGIALGMKYVHSLGYCHRDLKPSNICLTKDFIPKVVDFGLAKLNENTNTVGQGTFRYMAPEVSMEHYDNKVDVFSYAIILYELFCQPVWPQTKDLEVFMKYKVGERPEITSNCPVWIADIIQTCWDQDPNNRPSFPQIVDIIKINRPDCLSGLAVQELKHGKKSDVFRALVNTAQELDRAREEIQMLQIKLEAKQHGSYTDESLSSMNASLAKQGQQILAQKCEIQSLKKKNEELEALLSEYRLSDSKRHPVHPKNLTGFLVEKCTTILFWAISKAVGKHDPESAPIRTPAPAPVRVPVPVPVRVNEVSDGWKICRDIPVMKLSGEPSIGYFAQLQKVNHRTVQNLGLVVIAASSTQNGSVNNIVDFLSSTPFATLDKAENWIQFDFKSHPFVIKGYWIDAAPFANLRSWVIEGSNLISRAWTQLDIEMGIRSMTPSKRAYFKVQPPGKAFQFIRIRQLVNIERPNVLSLVHIDFHG